MPQIPLIDLDPLISSAPEGLARVAGQIRQAYSQVGFPYIINHARFSTIRIWISKLALYQDVAATKNH